jgi:hypothetical protein
VGNGCREVTGWTLLRLSRRAQRFVDIPIRDVGDAVPKSVSEEDLNPTDP